MVNSKRSFFIRFVRSFARSLIYICIASLSFQIRFIFINVFQSNIVLSQTDFFSIIILAFLNYYELALALNVLPIDTKATLEDKASSPPSSSLSSSSNDANVKVTGDVVETQTSKNIQAAGKLTTTEGPKLRKEKSDPYECPNTSEFSFFPHYCSRHANCLTIGKEYRCCRQFNSKRCVKGVPKPLKEQRHERNLNSFCLR